MVLARELRRVSLTDRSFVRSDEKSHRKHRDVRTSGWQFEVDGCRGTCVVTRPVDRFGLRSFTANQDDPEPRVQGDRRNGFSRLIPPRDPNLGRHENFRDTRTRPGKDRDWSRGSGHFTLRVWSLASPSHRRTNTKTGKKKVPSNTTASGGDVYGATVRM